MSYLEKRGNNAVAVNPPYLNGVFADIHLTTHGSDWLWAVFSLFVLTTLLIIARAYSKAPSDRAFHYITAAVTTTASIAYFTMASDLGFAPTVVEFMRGGKVAGNIRQIFYVRYIDWFITTPLLLLDLLLTAGMPWQRILWVVALDWVMIITGLVGALIPSRYKWGYFTFGCAAMLYIFWTMLGPARRSAKRLGPQISRAYISTGTWTLVLWALYPVAWGLCEGGNVISVDGEVVFYGVLDILTKIGFSAILLIQHDKIDPALMGCKIRGEEEYFVNDKHHSVATDTTATGLHNGHGAGVHNGTTATTTGRDGLAPSSRHGATTVGNTGTGSTVNPVTTPGGVASERV